MPKHASHQRELSLYSSTNEQIDRAAIDALKPGDAVIIFTPDPTHHPIAKYALERKLHVLVTKPATKLLEHHQELIELADKNGVVCWVEHHKRVSTFHR
jgi:D-galacturonate reductase